MYIKEITIEGFKTYKTKTVYSDLSSKINAIVGLNGSGKSNVYDAIQFVLSDKYHNLKLEEKQKLFHEGGGQQASTASVEIVIDNSSGLLPLEKKPIISVKRVMGMKKDEYFLDKKHVPRTDVVSLLESVGLFKSNPYYFVQQGRVMELVKMTDEDRLKLIMDVAGTATYEEKRAECVRIMHLTDTQRQEVEQVLATIHTRVEALMKDKDTLRKYRRMRDDRAELMRVKTERELTDVEATLKKLEGEVEGGDSSGVGEWAIAHEELSEVNSSVSLLRSKLNEVQGEVSVLKQQLIDVQAEIEQEKASLARRSDVVGQLKETEAKAKSKLVSLKTVLAERKGVLDEVTERRRVWGDKDAQETAMARSLQEALAAVNSGNGVVGAGVGGYDARISAVSKTCSDLADSVEKEEKELTVHVQKQNELQNELQLTLTQLKALSERQHQHQQEHTDAIAHLGSATSLLKDVVAASIQIHSVNPVVSIMELLRINPIPGVLGPLAMLVSPRKDIFLPCIEAVAGHRVNAIVCRDDSVCEAVVQLASQHRLRVTTIPANRVGVKQLQIEKSDGVLLGRHVHVNHAAAAFNSNSQNTSDMTSDINTSDMNDGDVGYKFSDTDTVLIQKVIQSIWGSTIIVPDVTSGTTTSKKYRTDCVTSQGDLIKSNGSLEGGFREHRVSYYNLYHSYLSALIDVLKSHFAVDALVKGMERERGEREQIEKLRREKESGIEASGREIDTYNSRIEGIRSEMVNCEREKEGILKTKERVEAVLKKIGGGRGDVSAISKELQLRIDEAYKKAMEAREKESEEKEMERAVERDVELTKEKVWVSESELHVITQQLSAIGNGMAGMTSDSLAALEHLENSIVDRISEMEALSVQCVEEESLLVQEMHDLSIKEQRLSMSHKDSTHLELSVISECRLLKIKQQQLITELNSLSPSLSSSERKKELAVLSTERVEKTLASINTQIGMLGRINPLADDQWTSLTVEEDKLLERLEELKLGRESIIVLMNDLDKKKHEAIALTLKNINTFYREVFATMVPGGKGSIVLHKCDDYESDGESESDEEEGDGRKLVNVSVWQEAESESESESASESESESEEGAKKKRKTGKDKKEKEKKSKDKKAKSDHKDSEDVMSDNPDSTSTTTTTTTSSGLTEVPQASRMQYKGVGIRVAFPNRADSNSDANTTTTRLSGGQKTICALALLMALQRTDPSPLYLFDEVDANLDNAYRLSVCNMIRQMSSRAQILCTTFRQEILEECDKFYKVDYIGGGSVVTECSMEDAQTLIEHGQ